MHSDDVGRKVVALVDAAYRPGNLDPPLVVGAIRGVGNGSGHTSTEFQEGVALVGAAGFDLIAQTEVANRARVLGLPVQFLAYEDRCFLVDAITQCVLAFDAAITGLHLYHDAVFGLAEDGYVVDGQMYVRVGARFDSRWEESSNRLGVGAVGDSQQWPT